MAMGSIQFALIAALLATYGAPLRAQQGKTQAGVYRVNVRVEVVDAQVVNKKTGRAIRDLNREDFQVYEDNVQQQITSFSQDELPLSVVLLFDLTDSVRPVLKSLGEGALAALQHLKPKDEVAVMTYAASTQLIQDFTTDRELAARAVVKASGMQSGEAAFFNEGVYQASTRLLLAKNPGSRRVIIWLTDDVPNFPSEEVRARYGRSLGRARLHTEKEAMKELLQTGATVYTLLQHSAISDEQSADRLSNMFETKVAAMQNPPGDVYRYAKTSGGHVVEFNRKHAQKKLSELIDDVRMRYSLAYHPSAAKVAGKFCSIKIKLVPGAGKHLIVEAKKGYYR
jgi:VWFA-related protein